MDTNQKSGGSARDQGREGSGSSMGKDLGTSGGTGIGSDLTKGASEAHKTIDKAAEAAQPVVDRLATTAHSGVEKVSGALNDAQQTMDDKKRQLSEAYRHFTDTGREYVRSSPATSVMIALAAGYTLSKLLGRRH